MVLPLIPLAGALIGRTVATRVGAGIAERAVAGQVGHFGGAALQRGIQNRHAAQGAKQDVGASQWAKQNPGEVAASATYAMMRGSTLRGNASASTNSLLQSTQFGAGA